MPRTTRPGPPSAAPQPSSPSRSSDPSSSPRPGTRRWPPEAWSGGGLRGDGTDRRRRGEVGSGLVDDRHRDLWIDGTPSRLVVPPVRTEVAVSTGGTDGTAHRRERER